MPHLPIESGLLLAPTVEVVDISPDVVVALRCKCREPAPVVIVRMIRPGVCPACGQQLVIVDVAITRTGHGMQIGFNCVVKVESYSMLQEKHVGNS